MTDEQKHPALLQSRRGRSKQASIVIDPTSRATILEDAESPTEISSPQELAEKLQTQSVNRVIVFIPSLHSYPVALPGKLGRKLSDPRRLAYLAEEQLPFSAEEMTIAAAPGGDRVLGVALLSTEVKPWIDGLEECGIETIAICPVGLAIVQHAAVKLARKSKAAIVVETAYGWEIGVVQNGRPVSWSTIGHVGTHDFSRFAMGLRDVEPTMPIWWLRQDKDVSAFLKDIATEWIEQEQECDNEILRQIGDAILSGQLTPWVDLRTGSLAPRDPLRRSFAPLFCALLGSIVALAAGGAILLERTQVSEEIRADLEQQQAALFAELFPAVSIPMGIENRLRSEQIRLEKTQNVPADREKEDSAFTVLHQALARLPSDLRFRVAKVAIDGKRLILEGEARNHSDVELIAQRLSADPRFQAALPRTRKGTERSFVFTITVEVGSASSDKEQSL